MSGKLTSRVWHIVQYIRHPDTGNMITKFIDGKIVVDKDGNPVDYGLNEEKIKFALSHKSIKKHAYILHNKDPYVKNTAKHKKGELKAPHYHVVIQSDTPLDVETIAKWFCIEPQYIKKAKGSGAFLDCVEYLTHETDKEQSVGKYRYPDEEVIANFDFRAELDERKTKIEKYGSIISKKEQYRYDVLYNGKSLKSVMSEDKLGYMRDLDKLKKLRLEYISNMPTPETRMNLYVSGSGGSGKGVISRAIARSLYPDLPDDEAFFEVGAPGSAFEGYDGQPVLIWNDRRAYDLLNELNGRGNVFNVFDTHPSRQRQNVKYSSINLANKVNIVNSVENYIHFLDGLSGEYHDKDGNLHESEMSEKIQAYRRFPIIIVIDSNKAIYDLMINKMLLNYYSDGMDYLIIHGLSAPFREIAEGLSGMPEKRRELEFLCVKEVIHWYNKILEKMKVQPQEHYDMIKKIIENQQISQYNFRVEHEAKTNKPNIVGTND